MSFSEQQVRQAFEQLHAPRAAIDATLQRIEQLRTQEEASRSVEPASSKDFRVIRSCGRTWRVGLAAACVALALVGVLGVGCKLYFETTAYVGIDVNPSIELGVNRFDIVVEVRGINEDGEAVLQQAPLLYRSFDEALELLGKSEAFRASVESAAVMEITISSDNEAQTQHLCIQGDRFIEEMPCHGTCSHASDEDRHEAHSHGMGVARYQAARELLALDSSLTMEDCAALSMRELRDRIAAYEMTETADEESSAGSSEEGEAAADQAAGNHHGQGLGGGHGRGGRERHGG